MKKSTKVFIGILIPVLIIFIALSVALPIVFTPAVKFDFSQQSKLSGRASGFLYGFAEDDIPTAEIAESIGINSLATKPLGGLQHPTSDVSQVADTFLSAGGELLMVYTQDMYDTWYYQLDSLEQYNERVRKTVSEMENSNYSDNLAYCIYNEMDNGQWFGDFWVKENRYKFYDAWLSTYTLIKEINPDAKIAGPGHAGYNKEFLEEFLSYCKSNNCLPEIVVWHELSDQSIYLIETNFSEYYAICDKLGIERLPVCISEYGLMSTNGIPGESVKWISRLEEQDAYGCVAYWRLADNLSDAVADDVTPNSNYWVYKFYAEMKGKELASSERDIMHSNVGKFLKRKAPLYNKGFIGCASFDESERKFYILAGGSENNSSVKIENIDEKYFKNGDKVTVKVTSVDYKGLGGAVYAPEEVMTKTCRVSGSKISFTLPCLRETQAFFIEITPYTGEKETDNDDLAERYEAENAVLSGNANITSEIAYACSEGTVVKGIDKNSSVEFTVKCDDDGLHTLDFVYGNGPVGIEYNEDGSLKNKGERISAEVKITVNGKEEITKFPSSIKEDYMECVSKAVNLNEGENTVRIEILNDAVIALDFMDVTEHDDEREVYFAPLKSRNTGSEENAFAVIVPEDGRYDFKLSESNGLTVTVNGTTWEEPNFSGSCITRFLHRGYNKISLSGTTEILKVAKNENSNNYSVITPDDVAVYNGASVETDANTASGKKIGRIASDTGSYCTFNINADESGYYNLTFEYAGNEEGGFHAYNVDLIERYITVSVNGEKHGNYFFRNTYSWENYKTKTVTVYLEKGDNEIKLSNDGTYSFNNNVTYAPNIGSIIINKF